MQHIDAAAETRSDTEVPAHADAPAHLQAVPQSMWQLLRGIRLLVLDVDGVLTDGGVFFDAREEALKRFHTLDGQGIKWLQQAGIQVAVVTGRDSQPLRLRLDSLGVQLVRYGCTDKWPAVQTFMQQLGLRAQQVAYMGDDWPDLAPMQKVGLAFAPAGAHAEVHARAHWVAPQPGGSGAVRHVCDMLLHASGDYRQLLQRYADAQVPADDHSAGAA